jgi:hypothetical protein
MVKSEEIEDKKEEIAEEKIDKKKQNRQILIIIIVLGIIIISIALIFFIKESDSNFEYINLEFQKTNTGGVIFYESNIPLADSQGNIVGGYPLRLREDPRKLRDINVDINNSEIVFLKKKVTYISLRADGPICENNIVSVVSLTDFLYNFADLDIKGALDGEEEASAANLSYVTCENHPNNTVILVKYGNETSIKKTGDNCYELEYKDCEINRVTEKFILTNLESYMKYFQRKI